MSEGNGFHDLSYTQNRELSWLSFNARVMEEAADYSVPLMERLRFLSIFSNNLDEFFMVRVGSLYDLNAVEPNRRENKSGMTPGEQLEIVYEAVRPLIARRDVLYEEICNLLAVEGIRDLNYSDMDEEQKKFASSYYKQNVRPLLSPQIIDRNHPFPHLKNKVLYVAALLEEDGVRRFAVVPVPESVTPILRLPGEDTHFIRMENVIAENMSKIFKKSTIIEQAVICVTRNADISFEDEKYDEDHPDFRTQVSKLLKQRDRLNPVRLELNGVAPLLEAELCGRLGLTDAQCYHSRCPLVMGWAYMLNDCGEWLYHVPHIPPQPDYIVGGVPLREQVSQRDILLFYPYHSMSPFLELLRTSADDPAVLSIKITIYRLAKNSAVARFLCMAAENGKDVTVLMELRARFDEQGNIEWAKILEEAGCKVIYGPENFKCHSKICLITRSDKGALSHIVQLGTGNYNEKTSELYTDFSVISADRVLCEDAVNFFQNMLIADLYGNYNKLLVAPVGLKGRIMELIDREIGKGPAGRIIIKANSVTERELIDKLSEASCAGVRVDLIIRGICCIKAGVPDKTENIRVTSVVGRFLEHSRIYMFGDDEQRRVFISSADIMTRNQERRVEIACPIESGELIDWFAEHLDFFLRDNVKARRMRPDGSYEKVRRTGVVVDVQNHYLSNPPSFTRYILPKKGRMERIKNFFRELKK